MSDLFDNLFVTMEDNSTSDLSTNVPKDSRQSSAKAQLAVHEPKEGSNSSKRKDADTSLKPKDSSTSSKQKDAGTSKSSSQKSIDRLTDIMASGFLDLKDLLKEQHLQNSRLLNQEREDISYVHEDTSEYDEFDMFESLADEVSSPDSVGPDVRPSLAALTDRLLNLKISDAVVKNKRDLYPRPSNVEFVNAPKINKPMWESLHHATKIKDSVLQNIQKDFLISAVPTMKVMEKIFDARDDMGSLDATELIDLLKDNFVFLGCANVGMIKLRRENIKRVLPRNMQGLCSDQVEHSSTYLFGDDLNASIKEVSELHKISNVFQNRTFPVRGARRGSSSRGTRSRVYRGAENRRFQRRYRPYDTAHPANRKPLNRQGPSAK